MSHLHNPKLPLVILPHILACIFIQIRHILLYFYVSVKSYSNNNFSLVCRGGQLLNEKCIAVCGLFIDGMFVGVYAVP